MAIDTISPVADSQIDPGDSFSFRVDNTYTSITVEVETSGGWEYAYDSSLGGAQGGYTVNVEDVGGRDEFTVSRSAGWNLSPFSIRVVEDETGSSATTTTNYTLYTIDSFPQSSDPYFLKSVADSLLSHFDTPSSYAGQGLLFLRVKATEDGIYFSAAPGGGGVTDHGALTGLADDDHVRYVDKDGTREQDAVLLTERPDHVNAPATGIAELWLRSDATQSLILTDELGADREVPALVTAGNANAVVGVNGSGTDFEFIRQRVVMGIVARFQALVLNTWYSADSTGKDSVWSTGYGSGADPITNTVVMHTPCTVEAYVVEHISWCRAATTGNTADIAFYENRLTDNSAVSSIAKIGTTLTLPGAGTTTGGNMYDLSGTFSSSNLLHADGFLSPFLRATSGPTSSFFQFRSTLFLDLV